MYVRYYPRMYLINPYVAQTPLRARLHFLQSTPAFVRYAVKLTNASDHHMLVAEFEFLD